MRQSNIYFCVYDLKKIRNTWGITITDMADKLFCSTRTVDRIESLNGTSNRKTAELISGVYSYHLEDLFIDVDGRLFNASFNPPQSGQVVEGMKYYMVRAWRTSLAGAHIYGKTMWIDNYCNNNEIRKLQPINIAEAIAQMDNDYLTVNTKDEWMNWLMHAKIGKEQIMIISEECIQRCLSYLLDEYVVAQSALTKFGLQDVVLLGDYKNRTDVFSINNSGGRNV